MLPVVKQQARRHLFDRRIIVDRNDGERPYYLGGHYELVVDAVYGRCKDGRQCPQLVGHGDADVVPDYDNLPTRSAQQMGV